MQRKEAYFFYLDHCHHALICDGIGADGEVSRWVSADNAIDCVPVRTVGLIPVHHCQVGHHHVYFVLWNLPGKLCGTRKERSM